MAETYKCKTAFRGMNDRLNEFNRAGFVLTVLPAAFRRKVKWAWVRLTITWSAGSTTFSSRCILGRTLSHVEVSAHHAASRKLVGELRKVRLHYIVAGVAGYGC